MFIDFFNRCVILTMIVRFDQRLLNCELNISFSIHFVPVCMTFYINELIFLFLRRVPILKVVHIGEKIYHVKGIH